MKELLRTTDPVYLSWVLATLADAGIEAHVFDQHMSIAEGSLGVLPRRVMVAIEDESRARWTLDTAEAALSEDRA